MHRNLFDICTIQSRMKIIGMVVDPLNAVAYIINRQPKNPPIVRIVIQSYVSPIDSTWNNTLRNVKPIFYLRE